MLIVQVPYSIITASYFRLTIKKGKILEKWQEGDSLWIKIGLSDEYLDCMVPKGFVSIDGVSLTICDVNPKFGWFTIMMVPKTQDSVIIPLKTVGDEVNIEVDIQAKLVQQSLKNFFSSYRHLDSQVKKLLKTNEGLIHRLNQLESRIWAMEFRRRS